MNRGELPAIDSIRRVHLIAIGGVAMTSLAGMLRARGYEVSGSDLAVYPPASHLLERLGIEVQVGYRPENLEPRPDVVVVGNAVSKDNPEVVALLASGIPFVSMPEALGRFFLRDKRSLVVAGTHGKSTSSAMLGWTLVEAGRDPSVMIGADSLDLGGNYRLGAGEEFVFEGDEYDTAFFDKGPKFLHYQTRGLVLTSIEFDHADIYADLEAVIGAFVRLLEQLPAGAPVVAASGAPNVDEALRRAGCKAERFGTEADADWRIVDLREDGGRLRFGVEHGGRRESELAIRLMGEINARNALGVYALGRAWGLSDAELRPGIESYRGVRRRQEVLLDGEVVVIDDFAHHPTAIDGVLRAIRGRYPERRLWAIFEPRSNTSRRRTFQARFPEALAQADVAVVAGVFAKESDRVEASERLSVVEIVDQLRAGGVAAETFPTPDEILAHLEAGVRAGDVVAFLSNGAFGGLPARAAARFASLSFGE